MTEREQLKALKAEHRELKRRMRVLEYQFWQTGHTCEEISEIPGYAVLALAAEVLDSKISELEQRVGFWPMVRRLLLTQRPLA